MFLPSKSLRRKLDALSENIASFVLIKTTIHDNDNVHRRIDPVNHLKPNGDISSAAYSDPSMSTDLERLTTIEKTMKGYVGFGLVSLPVAFLKEECSQEVRHRPLFCNRAHSLVVGKKKNRIKQLIKQMGNRNILVKPSPK